MRRYTKTIIISEPILSIGFDYCGESPRSWSNLGYFITIDRDYNSPDDNQTIQNIIKETGDEAGNREEHQKMITKRVKEETGEKVLAIYPVVKYEHSGVSYSLGSVHGFDYSNNGFYIVTDKSQKETGIKPKNFEKAIKQELSIYNQWCNGEVYKFILYGKDGSVKDSCSGLYNIEEVREYLPKGWENVNLMEYLQN